MYLLDRLRTDEALQHTVRALCRAPVVIFSLGEEIGGANAGGMLLMGIRAAVRREQPSSWRSEKLRPADWSALPFNLKELQVYGLNRSRTLESDDAHRGD